MCVSWPCPAMVSVLGGMPALECVVAWAVSCGNVARELALFSSRSGAACLVIRSLRFARRITTMKDRSHDEAMADYFRANPAYAEALFSEVCRDGDHAERAILTRQLQRAAVNDCVKTTSKISSDSE